MNEEEKQMRVLTSWRADSPGVPGLLSGSGNQSSVNSKHRLCVGHFLSIALNAHHTLQCYSAH